MDRLLPEVLLLADQRKERKATMWFIITLHNVMHMSLLFYTLQSQTVYKVYE